MTALDLFVFIAERFIAGAAVGVVFALGCLVALGVIR